MKKLLILLVLPLVLFSCGPSKEDIRNQFVKDSLRSVFVEDSILRLDTIKEYQLCRKEIYLNNILGDSVIWSYDSNDSIFDVKCYNGGKLKTIDTYHRDSVGYLIKIIISDKETYSDYEIMYVHDTINNTMIEILKNCNTGDLMRKTIVKYDDSGTKISKTTVHPIYGALSTIKYTTKNGLIVNDVEYNELFKSNEPLNKSSYSYDSLGNLTQIKTRDLVWNKNTSTTYEYKNGNISSKIVTKKGSVEKIKYFYDVKYYYKNKEGNLIRL